jgi:hypothetical protein
LETPDDARAIEWDDSPQARRFARLRDDTAAMARSLDGLRQAASFNPKHPPKET